MQSFVNIPIPTSEFVGLINFLRERGSQQDPVEVVQNAVAYWIDNAEWKSDSLITGIILDDEDRGYMWKNVFLPAGTIVRMKYAGLFYYARVEGDQLVYKNENLSPNQFALSIAGSARDAWRDLWVKRPRDEDYVPADELRSGT